MAHGSGADHPRSRGATWHGAFRYRRRPPSRSERREDLRLCARRTLACSCARASSTYASTTVRNPVGHSTIVLTSNTHRHVLDQRQRAVARGVDAVLGG